MSKLTRNEGFPAVEGTEDAAAVRAMYRALEGGDAPALARYADPPIGWVHPLGARPPFDGTRRDPAAVLRGAFRRDAHGRGPRLSAETLLEFGHGVLVVGRLVEDRCARDGPEEASFLHECSVRGGRAVRLREYPTENGEGSSHENGHADETDARRTKMLNRMASKAVRIARGTTLALGAAVMLAAVLGVATTALAGTGVGATFNLGQTNAVNALSRLVGTVSGPMLLVDNNGTGPALDLRVGPSATAPTDKAVVPMRVDSQARVANLNADELDGKNSTDFAPRRVEVWHEVGAPGEPDFIDNFGCGTPCPGFANFGEGYNTAGFYKDPYGVVHLKGRVRWTNPTQDAPGGCGWPIFRLPEGYRPAAKEAHPSIKNDTPTSINVDSADALYSGMVRICDGRPTTNGDWYSLDGISFRAAG